MARILAITMLFFMFVAGEKAPDFKTMTEAQKKAYFFKRIYFNYLPEGAKQEIKETPLFVQAMNYFIDPSKYESLSKGEKEVLTKAGEKEIRRVPNFDLVYRTFLKSIKEEKNLASIFYAMYFYENGFVDKKKYKDLQPQFLKVLRKNNNCYGLIVSAKNTGDEGDIRKIKALCPNFRTMAFSIEDRWKNKKKIAPLEKK